MLNVITDWWTGLCSCLLETTSILSVEFHITPCWQAICILRNIIYISLAIGMNKSNTIITRIGHLLEAISNGTFIDMVI